MSTQVTNARRHHSALAARNATKLESRDTSVNTNFPILKPGNQWTGIATSYDPSQYGGPMSGSCLWGGMNRNLANGQLIHGAAQMYSVFGNGISCGSCIKLTPTETNKYPGIEPFVVTVVNSCPPPCQSLDLEMDGIETWLQRPRVGQLGITGEIVPCGFKNNGVFIEIFQHSASTMYDVRMSIRGNSGAISLAETSCAGTNVYLPLKNENTNQYTLANGNGDSPTVLKCQSLDFRMTNFMQETIEIKNVPNKYYQQNNAGSWYKTQDNFAST
jgi:hypothetical protein